MRPVVLDCLLPPTSTSVSGRRGGSSYSGFQKSSGDVFINMEQPPFCRIQLGPDLRMSFDVQGREGEEMRMHSKIAFLPRSRSFQSLEHRLELHNLSVLTGYKQLAIACVHRSIV